VIPSEISSAENTPAPLIQVDQLTKRFDDVAAVDGISFDVQEGELFGFLGPNGAGKTTTINLLTGLARPDEGSIRVAGLSCTPNPKAAQKFIGVVPDESNLYPELTGFDNLCFCAALYGLRKKERRKRARELLDAFGLREAAHRKMAVYSKGMKRKLTIAAGIIHRPRILFLDEPTTGIDVGSARQLRQLVRKLHRAGTTIFLTTHYIEEAERLCERIAFIVKGRIVRTATIQDLLEPVQAKRSMLISVAQVPATLGAELSSAFKHLEIQTVSEGKVRVDSTESISLGPLVRFIEERGAVVTEARRLIPSLEEVFVQVTGIEAAAMRKEKGKRGPKK